MNISEPDPYLLLKGLNRIIKKPLEANRELTFRISLARSMLQVDSTPNASSVSSFAQHLLAEFEQIAYQEAAQGGGKKKNQDEKEKAKAIKLRKMEEEGSPKSPGKEGERPKCKFFLTDNGCRRGKSCTFSHAELKDEKRRCWICGCPDHMALSCTRPKGESPNPKAKAQKLEGDETPKGSQRDSQKEEGSSTEEGPSMKSLLEEANRMLKTLTTSQPGSSSSSTVSGGDQKDETMERLQQQLD